jgi:hypothetical protein
MLLDFFTAIIDPNAAAVKGATTGDPRDKINCDDMEFYGGASKQSQNRLLQKVFDAYPGGVVDKKSANLAVKKAQYLDDFIGMDQWTNGDAKVSSVIRTLVFRVMLTVSGSCCYARRSQAPGYRLE